MIPRYIDTYALRKEIDVDKYGKINTTITKLNIAIEHSRADVVEVVRCKDCKHWDGEVCYDLMTADENGYCSWGERRDDGEIH